MILVTLMCICFWQTEPLILEESKLWTRKVESPNLISIEIVSRKYEASEQPDIWLVGVAHIADGYFYEEVTSLLDGMDIVLFESVRPTGSRPPGGESDSEKVESTRLALDFVADIVKLIAEEEGEIPNSLDEVIANSVLLDSRIASWVTDASIGPWGRPFAMQVNPEDRTVALWCFGSDGKVGGSGVAADMFVTRDIVFSEELAELSEEQSVQEGMADALDLEFQLDSISYDNPNWFCSDLTIGEVEQNLAERGSDLAILDVIRGRAFTAKIATGMMKLLPILNTLVGGGIKETARLLMIEILTMPNSDEIFDGIDPELNEVIIIDRNTEVLEDIEATIATVEDLTSIGILYGAGHMKDLAQRLEEDFGYMSTEEKWFVAMSVNPNDSLLDQSDLNQMKFMLQYQMKKSKDQEEKLNIDLED